MGRSRDKTTRWKLTEVPGTLGVFDLILTVDSDDPKVIQGIEWAAHEAGLAIERIADQ